MILNIKRQLPGVAILSLLLISCQPDEKDDMFNYANKVYGNICMARFHELPPMLDDESYRFYQDMTEKDNLNFDSIYVIGEKYGLPYTALTYLMDYGRHMRQTENPADFFFFPVFEGISYFNIDGLFEIEESQYELGSKPRVGMSRDINGKKSLTWVQLTKASGNKYKLNILYNFRLAEYRYKAYYKEAREKARDASMREWLSAIYEQTGENKLDTELIYRQLDRKKEQCPAHSG